MGALSIPKEREQAPISPRPQNPPRSGPPSSDRGPHSKPEERSPRSPSQVSGQRGRGQYLYIGRCLSVERLFDCVANSSRVWRSRHKRTIKNQGRTLVEWEREFGPDPLITRYKDPREVALDIFTTNGSLSVDCQAVVITNSLGLLR